jgi:hypothetical protein
MPIGRRHGEIGLARPAVAISPAVLPSWTRAARTAAASMSTASTRGGVRSLVEGAFFPLAKNLRGPSSGKRHSTVRPVLRRGR